MPTTGIPQASSPSKQAVLGLRNRISKRIKIFAGIVVVVAVLAIIFSEGLMAVAMQDGDAWATEMVDDIVHNQTGIMLLGHVYDIDISARQVQISWLILGCGSLKVPNTQVYSDKGYCGRLTTSVDFYVDGTTDPTFSYNFKANPLNPQTGLPLFVQPMQSFSTTHLLVLYSWRGLDQQYGFPFDGYQLETMFVALNNSNNDSLPILGLRPISSTNNFNPLLHFDSQTQVFNDSAAIVTSRTMEMGFERTGFARTYVMTLFLVNWGLTAVVAFITVSALVGQEVSESILLLPISVILTIPALRALWDGAPAFGLLLDSCGTFLQMVIVSICSMFLVVQIGLNKPQQSPGGGRDALANPPVSANEQAHGMSKPRLSQSDDEKGPLGASMPLLDEVV